MPGGGQNGAIILVTSWAIIEVRCAALGQIQESISKRPEQVYLPSDPRLEWPGEGHYSSSI